SMMRWRSARMVPLAKRPPSVSLVESQPVCGDEEDGVRFASPPVGLASLPVDSRVSASAAGASVVSSVGPGWAMGQPWRQAKRLLHYALERQTKAASGVSGVRSQ